MACSHATTAQRASSEAARLRAAGDAAGSLHCLHQAATLSPRSAKHAVELGSAYDAFGQAESAAQSFARAVQLQPVWHR